MPQFGNNNSYCQDNEISWLDWRLLETHRDLQDFFKFMIAYRFAHPVIRRKLPDAVCGMEPLLTHMEDAQVTNLSENTRFFAVSFAGYDKVKGQDDLVYVAINTYWEDLTITLPRLPQNLGWYLSVNTFGDQYGRYCYAEGEEVHIIDEFVIRARSVAIFTGRSNNELGWR